MASPQRLRNTVHPGASTSMALPDPVRETLTRLGLTEEEFKAKQAEMMQGLLRSQPFVPQEASAANKRTRPTPIPVSFYETLLAGSSSKFPRARSSSISSSSSREPSPAPRTPARRERGDPMPSRPRDQMELIIEQRNRVKEGRRRASSRSHEDTRVISTPTQGASRPTAINYPPETPHHYRYYSERVVGEASGSRRTSDQQGGPVTPSTNRGRGHFKVPPPPSTIPKTPSSRHHDSSCPPTPRSSPPPVVNIVSSPGPMWPAPAEKPECLPYTLPPGPYSEQKPELSYAAIIGQAILASPGHALALQDIYEYITTVYPYYKRGEPTWMNSVRHALSTMAVFRKVQRDRSEGKSLWAIWDCDLPCFEGGGFKKALCADMINAPPRTSKKRGADEAGGSRSKRKKTGEDSHAVEDSSLATPMTAPPPVQPPYFPPMTASPYHQPYFLAACAQQQVPADVLFPPLPPSSNYHRVIARAGSIAAKLQQPPKLLEIATDPRVPNNAQEEVSTSSPVERSPSSSSVPELVPSLSASSSPTPSTQLSLPDESSRNSSPMVASTATPLDGPIEDPEAPWLLSDAPITQAVVPSTKKDKGKGKVQSGESTVKKRQQFVGDADASSSIFPHFGTPRYGYN
ncbi:hypothetical protein FKP32DRAFT_594974 [Trametes sanguinea]|nr:hypothetical protein FKP32DRAFT_594974 [Trametes sanguinea]